MIHWKIHWYEVSHLSCNLGQGLGLQKRPVKLNFQKRGIKSCFKSLDKVIRPIDIFKTLDQGSTHIF